MFRNLEAEIRIEAFLKLFGMFCARMDEKGIVSDKLPLFELFLRTPFDVCSGQSAEAPEYTPPTPEEVEAEALRQNTPEACYKCATGGFMGREAGPFPAGEEIIKQSPEFAFKYALAKNRPWPEAEERIATDPEWAYSYARDVLKQRFLIAEPTIAQSPEWAFKYARTVLGNRWPEAEETILADPVWGKEYKDYFKMK